MRTTRTILLMMSVIFSGSTAAESFEQRPPAPTPKPNQLQVAAVVGCVAADGDNWILTNATDAIVVPTADGKAQTGSGVTVEKAKVEPAGKERYRLMNMVGEFGVAQHKGQRVLVKGLVLGEGKDRRINMVSFEPIATTCGGTP
jgi:hypothetical protein